MVNRCNVLSYADHSPGCHGTPLPAQRAKCRRPCIEEAASLEMGMPLLKGHSQSRAAMPGSAASVPPSPLPPRLLSGNPHPGAEDTDLVTPEREKGWTERASLSESPGLCSQRASGPGLVGNWALRLKTGFHLLCLLCPLRTLGNNIPFLMVHFVTEALFSFPCLPKAAQSNRTGVPTEGGRSCPAGPWLPRPGLSALQFLVLHPPSTSRNRVARGCPAGAEAARSLR